MWILCWKLSCTEVGCEKIVLIPTGVRVSFPTNLPAVYKILLGPETAGDAFATVILAVPHDIFAPYPCTARNTLVIVGFDIDPYW